MWPCQYHLSNHLQKKNKNANLLFISINKKKCKARGMLHGNVPNLPFQKDGNLAKESCMVENLRGDLRWKRLQGQWISSCLKSGFSGIYYFRISPNVLQCIFCKLPGLSLGPKQIQCSNVLFCECQEINFCIEIHSNYLADFVQFDVQYICQKDLVSLQN